MKTIITPTMEFRWFRTTYIEKDFFGKSRQSYEVLQQMFIHKTDDEEKEVWENIKVVETIIDNTNKKS